MTSLVPVWVADLTDPRQTGSLLKWVQQQTPSSNSDPLAHLKRVRKDQSTGLTSVVISPAAPSVSDTDVSAPQLPLDIPLPDPYTTLVPALPALTMTSLLLKNTLWPTVYAPRRKNEPEAWTRGRIAWACSAIRELVQIAAQAKASGNLPIAAYIPPPYNQDDAAVNPLEVAVSGTDTRSETGHHLRHAVLAAIRNLADRRAAPAPSGDAAPGSKNGSHYLLTSLTAFVTHEPCIMCTMALLHSRVKDVVFLSPLPSTGGCGGVTCVPALGGVNHRFGIYKWSLGEHPWAEWWRHVDLEIPSEIDA
jgi:tRNA-specific adenosine deaminase 3